MSKSAKIRLTLFALTIVLVPIILISAVFALKKPVLIFLGFDMTDYESEEVISYLPGDSASAKKITDIIEMLLYSPTAALVEFDGAGEVAEKYTDSILSYLMGLNYSKYVCNVDLLSRASNSYSNYNFRTVIPVADFKSEIYRAFGGNRAVTGKSGDIFSYHEKIDAFSIVGTPHTLSGRVLVRELAVTEHTYKMIFAIESEGDISSEYLATAINRDDGTLYIKSIKKLDKN